MSFEVETSPDADMVDLTICTVYTPNLEPYLRLNWELISTLNRRNNWRWLIVDNSEEPEKLFPLSARVRREIILPISFGSSPLILLEDNISSSRLIRLPIS